MGKVIGSHGVKGWLKIHPFTEKIETLSKYANWLISPDEKHWDDIKVEKTIIKNNVFLVKLDNINDRNESDVLKKYMVGIRRNKLPKLKANSFYWSDLIGLNVESKDGVKFGVVDSIMETGSNDVLVVKGNNEILIPYLPDVILSVDLKTKRVLVDWYENY
tara:strand:- start:1246 stop:1728 length:483 start_codon:yes stop_codon:yes gene_type:complete